MKERGASWQEIDGWSLRSCRQISNLGPHQWRHLDLRAGQEYNPLTEDLEEVVRGRSDHRQKLSCLKKKFRVTRKKTLCHYNGDRCPSSITNTAASIPPPPFFLLISLNIFSIIFPTSPIRRRKKRKNTQFSDLGELSALGHGVIPEPSAYRPIHPVPLQLLLQNHLPGFHKFKIMSTGTFFHSLDDGGIR